MIYTVTLNPALDKTVEIQNFKIDSVNRVESVRIDAGGKGINVSRVINKLGGETEALGILGGHSGKQIIERLNSEGIKNEFLLTDDETRTNLKIVDYSQGTYTDINESGKISDKKVIDELLSSLLEKVTDNDIVVFAGSLPSGAEEDTYNKWINKFNKKGIKVFLDADRKPLKSGIEAKPYFIKPNIDEFSWILGESFKTMIMVRAKAQELIKKGIKKVAVTLGEGGSLLVTENKGYYAEPLKVNVKSTVGAGDSFLAAVALCEQAGKSDAETLKFAAAVSSAKVMCEGTEAPDIELVKKLLQEIIISEI